MRDLVTSRNIAKTLNVKAYKLNAGQVVGNMTRPGSKEISRSFVTLSQWDVALVAATFVVPVIAHARGARLTTTAGLFTSGVTITALARYRPPTGPFFPPSNAARYNAQYIPPFTNRPAGTSSNCTLDSLSDVTEIIYNALLPSPENFTALLSFM